MSERRDRADEDGPTPERPWPELLELAGRLGIATEYQDWQGAPVTVTPATLVAVLRAFDIEASDTAACRRALTQLDASRPAVTPRCVVMRAGVSGPAGVTVRATASEEIGAAIELGVDPLGVGAVVAPGRVQGFVSVPASDGSPVKVPRGAVGDTATDDDTVTTRLTLPSALPVGAHTLRITIGDTEHRVPVLVAPERLHVPESVAATQTWGYTLQLHALRSRASWGMGDLADLAEFVRTCVADLGAGFVVANPLHAGSPAPPIEPSPYLPVSRRFSDPLHLRVEAIPEYASPALPAAERARIEELAAATRPRDPGAPIDRDAVWHAKHAALRALYRVPLTADRAAAYQAYVEREGDELRRFAAWCVLAERHGTRWQDWPTALRDPESDEVARLAKDAADEIDFCRWSQWQLDQQLAAVRATAAEAGLRLGIVHDLAVGSSSAGAETWANPDVYAAGMTTGAPPDSFNQQGQTWGSRPWRPDRLAEAGYAPYRSMLRSVLRHADGLRIDHVMGLFRLWWVPDGMPANAGTYVSYDHDAMLGVLALEAAAAGAMIIGEDLGTVEPAVRTTLGSWGAFGTSVLWFERDATGAPLPPERWRRDCLATLTTHDLPTTAARLTGEHVELRDRLGLLTTSPVREREQARAEADAWLRVARERGLLSDDDTADVAGPADAGSGLLREVDALYRLLRETPCRLLGVWLPDAFGDRRAHNLPGTTGDTYPNWCLPVADADGRPVLLDEMPIDPRLRALARALDQPLDRS